MQNNTKKQSLIFFAKQISTFVLETLYNIIVIILIVAVVRTFLLSPFHVSGQSMMPTLQNNDYIIIDKLSYRISDPEFQDIIVFTPPNPRMRMVTGLQCAIAKVSSLSIEDEACSLPDFFIKRIIGVPGDIIEIDNGEVIRNGEQLDEIYLDEHNNHRTFVPEKDQYKKYIVPENKFFVLGDNRNGSSDSRAHSREWKKDGDFSPFVEKDSITGRLFFTLFSPKSFANMVK